MNSKLYPILHNGKKALTTLSRQQARRDVINARERARLKNKDFSLISSNCNGAMISHDLGQQFRTQFVNLTLMSKDFVRYLGNLEYYNSIDEIRFLPEEDREGWNCPVGVLKDLRIYFVHYHSDDEALQKWNERKKRMNPDNLFIIMSEQNGCSREDMLAFDALPFKNKVVFTHKPYEDVKCAFYIPGFEDKGELGNALAFKNPFSAERWYDVFPFVDWFNGDFQI